MVLAGRLRKLPDRGRPREVPGVLTRESTEYEATQRTNSRKTAAAPATEQGPVYDPRLRQTPGAAAAPGQGFPGRCSHACGHRRDLVAGDGRPCQPVRGKTAPASGASRVLGHGGYCQSRSWGRDPLCHWLRCDGGDRLHLVHVLGLQGKRASGATAPTRITSPPERSRVAQQVLAAPLPAM